MRRTATTANAILGLLALRPRWSTWELRNELKRNMRFFWPRAESRILAELKRLDQEGLASAEREMIGRRPRTTYSITPAGRNRLREWLAAAPRETTLECEPILRTLLGSLGSLDQVDAAVAQVEADAEAVLAVGRVVAEQYLTGTAPFQDQVEYRAFVFDFLVAHATAMHDWSQRTRLALADWPQLDAEQRTASAHALIEQQAARMPPPA